MPRTIVPEEQQRVSDLTTLKNSIRPTTNRTVHVDSDADGAGNIFRWDPSGDASTADGVTTVASNISQYASGGADEGLWRRMQLPFVGATTEDLAEAGSLSGAPAASDRIYFTDSRAISAIEDNANTLQIDNGISMNSSSLTDLPTPSNGTDATTKDYVDGLAQGLEVKDSVNATSQSDIDLASTADPSPVDGYTLQDGDRILLQGQTDATENGIYDATTATDPTTWTRSSDFDEDADVVSGAFAFVENGTNYGDNSYIVITDDPISVGTDAIEFSQFSSAGELLAGDGLNKSGNTFSVVVSDFAGTYLSDDGSDNLQVDIGSGLVNDGNDNIRLDLGISDSGTDVGTTNYVEGIDFGSSLNVTDNTGSGDQRVTVDVDTTSSTSITIKESGGSALASDVNSLNFSSNLDVSVSSREATINVPDSEVQDAVFNSVLTGTQTLISVSYDDTNNEVDYVVDDDLSSYDNSTSDFISGIDVDDGTTDIEDPVDNVIFGTNMNVSNATAGDKTVEVSTVDTTISVRDSGGSAVESAVEDLNFGVGLDATSNGSQSNGVTIDNEYRFGTAAFSGDGVQTEFQIAHGLANAPSSWTIEATTDDGSGHSHSKADSTNITVYYDTAPPSGTDNIELNYSLSV